MIFVLDAQLVKGGLQIIKLKETKKHLEEFLLWEIYTIGVIEKKNLIPS